MTREPEWNDSARARALRLDEYDQSIDSDTGLPREEAYKDQPFVVHSDVVNHARAAIDRVRADDAEKHKDDPRWMDGRRYYAEPYNPDDPD